MAGVQDVQKITRKDYLLAAQIIIGNNRMILPDTTKILKRERSKKIKIIFKTFKFQSKIMVEVKGMSPKRFKKNQVHTIKEVKKIRFLTLRFKVAAIRQMLLVYRVRKNKK